MKGVFVALLVVASTVQAFYIPGIEPRSHKPGAEIVLNVNSVRSVTQLVPHEYYSLPFCQPQGKNLAFVKEQLGQTLWGDDMTTSPYVVKMRNNSKCQPLKCLPSNAKAVRDNIDMLAKFIEDDYRGYMSLDNLPGFNNGTRIYGGRCSGTVPQEQMNFFARGYALGVPKWCKGKTMINNFLQFNLKYHRPFPDKDEFRVVGFTIKPYSIALDGPDECGADQTFNPVDLQAQKPLFAEDVKSGKRSVVWSYGVTWEEDTKVSWGSRWDSFFATSYADTHMRIHWTFIIYLLLITLCLALLASIMLLRTLHKDIAKYNIPLDDGVDETGWKLVHADVFRPPNKLGLLSMVAGTGTQLFMMAGIALMFAVVGFLSPANRGGLVTMTLLLFVLMSFAGGYVCGTILKTLDAKQWKTVFGCAMMGPGSAFGVFFFVNTVYWGAGGSNAISVWTMFLLLGLFLGVSVPLVVLGASFAFHNAPFELPVKVGRLAREIPAQIWYLRFPFIHVLPGFIPFVVTMLELKFIFESIWLGMVYYVFGFLFIVFMVWITIVVLVTIIGLYYQLVAEDYRWWWRSMAIPSGCGIYVVLFSMYYYMTELNIKSSTGTVVYFTYTTLFALAYACTAGTIGFVAGFFFVRRIYGSIKID